MRRGITGERGTYSEGTQKRRLTIQVGLSRTLDIWQGGFGFGLPLDRGLQLCGLLERGEVEEGRLPLQSFKKQIGQPGSL